MKTYARFKDEMLDILRSTGMCYFEGQNVDEVVFEEDINGEEQMVVWFKTPDNGEDGYYPPGPGRAYFAVRLPKGTTVKILKEWKSRL